MGRGLKDVAHAENAPYDFLDVPGMVQLRTVAGSRSPVEISAEILRVLRSRGEKSAEKSADKGAEKSGDKGDKGDKASDKPRTKDSGAVSSEKSRKSDS